MQSYFARWSLNAQLNEFGIGPEDTTTTTTTTTTSRNNYIALDTAFKRSMWLILTMISSVHLLKNNQI
jgi:hypothetical protein